MQLEFLKLDPKSQENIIFNIKATNLKGTDKQIDKI